MVKTDVSRITWTRARTADHGKINLICAQDNVFFQDTVSSTIAALMGIELRIDDAVIVAKWKDIDDPVEHNGTIVAVDTREVQFDDGVTVPMHAVVAVKI